MFACSHQYIRLSASLLKAAAATLVSSGVGSAAGIRKASVAVLQRVMPYPGSQLERLWKNPICLKNFKAMENNAPGDISALKDRRRILKRLSKTQAPITFVNAFGVVAGHTSKNDDGCLAVALSSLRIGEQGHDVVESFEADPLG